jgi:hypothetical protein
VAVAAQALEDQGPDGAWFDGYEVYWKQLQAGAYAVWVLDDMGARTSGRVLTQPEVRAVESRINLDLNGDELVGFPQVPFTLVQTVGQGSSAVDFGTTAAGYALRVGGESGQVIPLVWNGANASPTRPGASWQAVGAWQESSSSSFNGGGIMRAAYSVLWANEPSRAFSLWTVDESGAFVSGRPLTYSQAQGIAASLVSFDPPN